MLYVSAEFNLFIVRQLLCTDVLFVFLVCHFVFVVSVVCQLSANLTIAFIVPQLCLHGYHRHGYNGRDRSDRKCDGPDRKCN